MSHGDAVTAAPEGFSVLASTEVTPVAAFEDVSRGMAGVQWHPEVMHSEHGQEVLEHFLHDIAGCRQTWTMVNIVEEQIEIIRQQVGEGRAICGLSGGVDSAVAAAIVQRAIGDRLTCVYVDHG
jgi:GMP synthase (glutamine-hydrolysing)